MRQCAGMRCGALVPPQETVSSFADLRGFHNISVPEGGGGLWRSASGGIARERGQAALSALGEALERYSAAIVNFAVQTRAEITEEVIEQGEFSIFSSNQYAQANFPYPKPDAEKALYGRVFSLFDNSPCWVPQELIGLGPKRGQALFPSTSSGLAAHNTPEKALLAGLQEILERDALGVYWQNSLGGRELALPPEYAEPVKALGGQVFCFDFTQDWNPHPVIAVCGCLPQRGKKRISLGVACRSTFARALEKAYAEWIQGCIFAGYYALYHPGLQYNTPESVNSFDAHAVYYTLYPERWENTPLVRGRFPCPNRFEGPHATKALGPARDELLALLPCLKQQGIRLFYRRLETPDVSDAGVYAVRVMSPELSPLHGDEAVPFLGGRVKDLAWRYSFAAKALDVFPNPYPHPLG